MDETRPPVEASTQPGLRSETIGGPEGVAPLLEMQGITKDFPGGRVLHGVDFTLAPGEVHALVGQNGAGKSTLMKILAGVYPDHGGTIRVDGQPVQMSSPRRSLDQGIAVIYQEFALASDFTVAENIALGREPTLGFPGTIGHRSLVARSRRDAERLGIDLPMDRVVGELSVGDQQLTEIVKAVSRNARVLVMDEPTARLSSEERDRLFEIIRRLSASGVGIVYISHYLEEIFSVAQRVTVLRDGEQVPSPPFADLDVPALARLMVGDKFRAIEVETRANLARKPDEAEAALTVTDLGIEGILAPTTFTIRKGEVLGFAGLQGSGRTEMADAIVGNRPARRSGIVTTSRFSGLARDPRQALKAGILMLPASRKTQGILAVRPVGENIAVAAIDRHLSRWGFVRPARRRRLVAELMERYGVKPANPDLEISALSGGNQQKALFARATAAQADILILDQPTAGVDVGATVELYDQVDALTDAGVAVLLISDDLTELLRLSDSIVLVKNGVASEPRPASDYDRASLLAAITGKELS